MMNDELEEAGLSRPSFIIDRSSFIIPRSS